MYLLNISANILFYNILCSNITAPEEFVSVGGPTVVLPNISPGDPRLVTKVPLSFPF